MATVSNVSDQTLMVPGYKGPVSPHEIGVHSEASEAVLRGHLFYRAGLITVEGTSVSVEAPAEKPEPEKVEVKTDDPEPEAEPEADSEQQEKTPLEQAKEEASETQDMDRLMELAADDRKTVAKIAQKRLDEMGNQ